MRAFISMLAILAALTWQTSDAAAKEPRTVNVTADSEAGWLPSVEQEENATKTAKRFLAALDSAQYEQAFALLQEQNKALQSQADYIAEKKKFHDLAGASLERRVTFVTWTKNPQYAPFPGIYAAIDLVSRFENIDRHCGYLIMYQAPSGGDFQVMRDESAYLDNTNANNMTEADLTSVWAALSAHCPNYTEGS
jgi:hypothetical protein